MPATDLLQVLRAEVGDLSDELDEDTLDRILIEPHQEALAEAIAADVVDAAPLAGDLLAAVRQQRAEAEGLEYPDQPAYIENAISDLPVPIDTIGDLIVSQNVLLYLRRRHGLDIADEYVQLNEQGIKSAGEAIDALTPGSTSNT